MQGPVLALISRVFTTTESPRGGLRETRHFPALRPMTTERQVPWASFCLATYRRPVFLRQALEAIQRQIEPDFEVIISDNDPAESGREIVAGFQDERFHYFSNRENLGIVGNFKAALARARGRFVVLITDDDPAAPELLSTLRGLEGSNPGYAAYYGACQVEFTSPDVATMYGFSDAGLVSLKGPGPADAVRLFSADEFPSAFLKNQVFPYMLWSTGIIRRDVVLAVGSIPDYGTPYLADLSFLCLIGTAGGCATINRHLGHQSVHEGNFGRAECAQLPIAVEGCHRVLSSALCGRGDWPALKPILESFVANWVIGHALSLEVRFRQRKDPLRRTLREAMNRVFAFEYIRPLRVRYYLSAWGVLRIWRRFRDVGVFAQILARLRGLRRRLSAA